MQTSPFPIFYILLPYRLFFSWVMLSLMNILYHVVVFVCLCFYAYNKISIQICHSHCIWCGHDADTNLRLKNTFISLFFPTYCKGKTNFEKYIRWSVYLIFNFVEYLRSKEMIAKKFHKKSLFPKKIYYYSKGNE